MQNYVLFLDDERQPPKPSQWCGLEIIHARTPTEFVTAIKERGAPFAVLFDWYLGSGQASGLEMAQWLIEHDREHDVICEDMIVDSHSSDHRKAREIVGVISEHMRGKFSSSSGSNGAHGI